MNRSFQKKTNIPDGGMEDASKAATYRAMSNDFRNSKNSDSKTNTRNNDRGRDATTPVEIPARGWKDIALRIKDELQKDNISIVAAGVAFYGFLALFPAMVAGISLYGLFLEPSAVTQQVESFAQILPPAAQELISEQLHRLAEQENSALSWGAILGILTAFWSSTKGVKAMMAALNIVYDEREERGFIKVTLTALAITIGVIISGVLALTGIIGVPALLANTALDDVARITISLIRWPLLLILSVGVLAVLYKWGPDREEARISWLSAGAILASVSWLIASIGFSWFVSNFGNFSNTYGTLAAVVLLMLWMLVTAYIILLGGELNAEMEHQTAEDTTTGPDEPMGSRGAYVADHVGKKQGKR